MSTYRTALGSAKMEESVRTASVCVETASEGSSVSKKVSRLLVGLLIFDLVSADFGGSNLLAFISVALIIATLATLHVARNITRKA